MSYRPLLVPDGTPAAVEEIVRGALEMRLRDVHAMLRLPLPRVGMDAGCNFAIVDALLAVTGGVATVLYPRDDPAGDGSAFKTCLEKHYDTSEEPTGGLQGRELGEGLWTKIRNPLAHCLGLALEKKGLRQPRVAAQWGHGVKIVRDRGSWSASELDAIEAHTWPACLHRPTLEHADGFLKLTCEAFYRGTRRLVESVLKDEKEMTEAAARLERLYATPSQHSTISGPGPTTAATTGAATVHSLNV